MIRAEHAREDMVATKKVIDDPKSSVQEMLKAVYKLVAVAIKVGLSNRTNSKIIMEKVGAKQLAPKIREEIKKEEK